VQAGQYSTCIRWKIGCHILVPLLDRMNDAIKYRSIVGTLPYLTLTLEILASGALHIDYVPTVDEVADGFTKALAV
jgi:hypothetical protein